MGGFFSPGQTPAQVISPIPQELGPFAAQLTQAISNLFRNPGPMAGVTPLEQTAIEGQWRGAMPAIDMLGNTISGGYLPGQPGANPFLDAMYANIDAQGATAQRQLASAAQRAGALSSTDYVRQAGDTANQFAMQKAGLLGDLWNRERSFQYGAIPQLGTIGQQLQQSAAIPRQVATEGFTYPFSLATSLLGANRASVNPGQQTPSPFSSLLNLWTAVGHPGVIF